MLSPYAVLRPAATAGRAPFPARLDARLGAGAEGISEGEIGPTRPILLAARVTLRLPEDMLM